MKRQLIIDHQDYAIQTSETSCIQYVVVASQTSLCCGLSCMLLGVAVLEVYVVGSVLVRRCLYLGIPKLNAWECGCVCECHRLACECCLAC